MVICVEGVCPKIMYRVSCSLTITGPCKIDDTYQISEYDVLKHEKLTSRKIGKGSIVCFFSGWSKKWLDPYRYKNGMRFPGLSESCMALLISRFEVCALFRSSLSS